jgi:hypothetical protein
MWSINHALRYSTTGVGNELDLPRPWAFTVTVTVTVPAEGEGEGEGEDCCDTVLIMMNAAGSCWLVGWLVGWFFEGEVVEYSIQ